MTTEHRAGIGSARRIVVKVGSSSISGAREAQLGALVDAIAERRTPGAEIVLVSSGAIATGLPYLELDGRPDDLATQQAAAAVGQNMLVNRYQQRLDAHAIVAGQVLLTSGDLAAATPRMNALRAMERLLGLGILPIVNENDTVATAEIRFGDNDRLAALVAILLGADALVLLSDVDAIYTRPPSEPGAERVASVPAGGDLGGVEFGAVDPSGVGTGGAGTKAHAARLAAAAGVGVLVTGTAQVRQALAGGDVGTWFAPAERPTVGVPGVARGPRATSE